jgi:endonuclease VIII
VPEGDAILWAATRMRPVLEGHVPESVRMPAGRPGALRGSPGRERWPERLAGRTITAISTHGKNLFVHFEGGLLLHSHLKMTGSWGVYPEGRRWRRSPSRAWLVMSRAGYDVVQFDGPVLELITEGRRRFDQRLSALGPDILEREFKFDLFLARLRADDPTRPIGDALLDQRTIAGIGNIWKSEGCWEARIDPWRPVRQVSDAEAIAIVEGARPRMLQSGTKGPQHAREQVYRKAGRPCPRCGTPLRSKAQGDGNRMTYWCPGCQH